MRLALPLIGTGKAGLRGIQGHTLEPLVTELNRVARVMGVDFMLCTPSALAWSAVQSVRGTNHWRLTQDE